MQKKLIAKVNHVTSLINKGEIKHPAIIELIEIVKQNELKNQQWIEEVEAENLYLHSKLSQNDNTEIYIRLQSLGFSLFQFMTFDIGKAFSAQHSGKLRDFMNEHKKTIKCLMK
jgi:hypothetical protein